MVSLRAEVSEIVRRDGVIARREHARLARAIDAMAGEGELVAVLPGVFAPPRRHDDFETRVRAAVLHDPDLVLTGTTAARLTFWPELRQTVVRGATRWQRAARPGFVFERRSVPPGLVVQQGRLRTTAPALTALDLCDDYGGDGIDHALRTRSTTLRLLHEAFEQTAGRRGNGARRRLLVDSRDEPWSAAERLCHRILRSARLPRWTTNLPVRARGRLYYLDVAFPGLRIALEIDGRSHHTDRTTFESDRQRQNALVLDGWLVLRFTWQMIEDQPDQVLAAVEEAIRSRRAELGRTKHSMT